MSEGGGGDGGGGYPGGPTPSSTVPDAEDGSKSGLPPFSSFGDMDGATRISNTDGEALQTSRLLDISSWDYYGEGLSGRLLDRGDGFPMLIPQPQYRPWESKDGHDYPGSPIANKLPSFQSQFTAFPQDQNGETVLTTLTPAPPSPNSSSSGLPSFHTLSTVPPRGYPLVPAPVQAREIPSIQQQLLDERHIHLFQGAPHQQYHQLGAYQPQQQTTLLTVVKTEPLIVTQLQGGYDHHELKMEDANSPRGYLDSRKKERRKIRASSMESSNESDGVGSSSVESSGQVAAISSTAGFKSPLACHQNPNIHSEDDIHEMSDKPVKKKRKRCGECIGCQRKDNCGDCAPCRNDKSHQICKMRRCEKLTEKKHLLYLNHDYPRGERGRGRGKGRGGGSYRKVHQNTRSPLPSPNLQLNGSVDSNMMSTIPDHSAAVRGESKIEPPVSQPGLPPITPSAMPLYSGPVQSGGMEGTFTTPLREHRFTNAVWQPAPDPNGTWSSQGQFIQQIPPPQLEELRYPQYAVAGYPQATPVVGYQQNSFMQTNGTVYNGPSQPQPSPHSLHNGNSRSTPTLNGNMEYEQSPRPSEYMNGSYHNNQSDVMAPPTSSTPTSRCGSAQLENTEGKYTNPPTPTTPSNQGNAMPGYPHQMPPQSAQSSHNSSGYPGQENSSSNSIGEKSKISQSDAWSNGNKEETQTQTEPQSMKESWSDKSTETHKNGGQNWAPAEGYQTKDSWNRTESETQTTHPPQQQEMWSDQHGQSEIWTKPQSSQSVPPWISNSNRDRQQEMWPSDQQLHQMHNQQIQYQQMQHHQAHDWSGQPNAKQQNRNPPEPWPNEHHQNQQMWNEKKHNQYPERAELNNRLKTMILNKQQQEVKKSQESSTPPNYQDQKNLQTVSSGNFLAQGHHPRKLVSEGGGVRDSNPSTNQSLSAMENFVKYATMGYPDLKQTTSPNSSTNETPYVTTYQDISYPRSWQPLWKPTDPKPYWPGKPEPWSNPSDPTPPQVTPVNPKSPFEPNQEEVVNAKTTNTNPDYAYHGDGGPVNIQKSNGPWCCRKGGTENPTDEHKKEGCCHGFQTQDEIIEDKEKSETAEKQETVKQPEPTKDTEPTDKLKTNTRTEIPTCQCFAPDQCPPEPGPFYTHLGFASTLAELRSNSESRMGFSGKAIRMEKVLYTGKEGKTTVGCPLAKYVIRRVNLEEKVLMIVKNRLGHKCATAWIVIAVVVWDGVQSNEADSVYDLLTYKLNKFGLATTRRCATNEPRTCACQGLDPDNCGASFSFGCSWSMYYNGCKFARSKDVRKFKLSVRSQEDEVEDKLQILATHLAPLYQTMAPDSYNNQVEFESEASDCRLGLKPGRPFSGVTACVDFCAHSHRDLHNMNNGCTVVVSLTKHRAMSKPSDEQLHVLPLYVMDETDEFGSKEAQLEKSKTGAVENLTKFPCEVRVRAVPLTPCRRHGKKRKDEEESVSNLPPASHKQTLKENRGNADFLQSSQISSTVVDSSPVNSYIRWQNQSTMPMTPPSPSYHDNGVRWKIEKYSNQYYSDNNVKIDPDSTTNNSNRNRNPYENTRMTSPYPDPHMYYYPDRTDRSTSTPDSHSQVFRRPIGRPPSRSSNPSTPQPVDSTFLKPRPPPQDHKMDPLSPKECGDYQGNHYSPGYYREPNMSPSQHSTLEHPFSDANMGTLRTANQYYQNYYREKPPNSPARSQHGGPSFQPYDDFQGIERSSTPSSSVDPSKNYKIKQENDHWAQSNHFKQEAGCQYNPGDTVKSTEPNIKKEYEEYRWNEYHKGTDDYAKPPPWRPGERVAVKQEYAQTQPTKQDFPANPGAYHQSEWVGDYQFSRWNTSGPTPYLPAAPEPPKPEPIGQVTDYIQNEECFKDTQMGGVAIALGHGSVLFECAKHELHATTALHSPNRKHPTRISLVFYQHRNLNRPNHGSTEWSEKMRLKEAQKLGVLPQTPPTAQSETQTSSPLVLKSPTYTTTTWTTLFPMHPCVVTGPYQESETLG